MAEPPQDREDTSDRPGGDPEEDPFGICGQTLGDKYRVASLIGAGGFGVVYRGVHQGFGEPIAIKCLKVPGDLGEREREELLTKLQDEGRVLHRLSKLSSGIVQALDVDAMTTPNGQWVPYLVLEWLEGETLAEHLTERASSGQGPMSLEQAMALLEPAARALAVAHGQKVAHRDVKPENIHLMSASGQRAVKLLDFGIAKVLTQHAVFTAAPAATQKTASAFTPCYGAPEQFNKKRGATGPWTDVFALGLILVELVSGERALDGEDATQLYIAAADPASRPTLRYHGVETSDRVEEVLRRALAIDPNDRYQEAGAFWDALQRAAEEKPTPEPPPADVSETGDFVVRHDIALGPDDLSAAPGAAADGGSAEADDETGAFEPAGKVAADASTRRAGSGTPLGGRREASRSDKAEPPPRKTTPSAGQRARRPDRPAATTTGDAERSASSRWMPLVVLLALAGAAALYLQLRDIEPKDVDGDRTPATRSLRTPNADYSADRRRPKTTVSAVAPLADAGSDASSDAAIGDAATMDGGLDAALDAEVADAEADADGYSPYANMIHLPQRTADGGIDGGFFIDRAEVSTGEYRSCVMAGRCVPATRIVLTPKSAQALGVEGIDDSTTPEQLVTAWGKLCNEMRGKDDHPVNCVSHASSTDYCRFKGKRLPSSAEWTASAASDGSRRFPWGDTQPECTSACFGLNGSCVASASAVATCAVGARTSDKTAEEVIDLAGNVAEWVSDSAGVKDPHEPPWRVLRGGSFADEADRLVVTSKRAIPVATAYVTVGFRCALDAPDDYVP